MNSQVGVNILVVLSGLVLVALVFLLDRYLVADQHPLRQWAAGVVKRNGLVQTARLAGVVLLLVVGSVIAVLYS